MEIAVLITGVADPKWPLPQEFTLDALQAHASRHAALSPFDEAALELALKLRDQDPAARISALVAGDDALARRVAGWRTDTVCSLDLECVQRWNGAALAAAFAQALAALCPDAQLVLVGRELGDWDEGTAAAALAHEAGLPHAPLALAIEPRADGLWALRQSSGGLERVHLPQRALLSVTNDPNNRLRHPLMKNVMLAKKASIPVWRAQASDRAPIALDGIRSVAPPMRSSQCVWLEGSAQQQAQALSDLLRSASNA